MRPLRHIILLLCLTTLCPKAVMAQIVPRDIPTIEAYINDHKKQRSLLLARATLEESNALLHKASKVTHREYRDINLELDKYTRAFDIIDLVYSTVSTGFNVYRTYDNVSENCCLPSMPGLLPILPRNAKTSIPPSVCWRLMPVARSVAPRPP